MTKQCCSSNAKGMAVTNDLLKVIVPPPQIVPVGITPAENVNGKMAMQTQGRGEGIFSKIIDGAAILYSTVKNSKGTVGAVTTPAINAGFTYGTGQDKQTDNGQPVEKAWYEENWVILLGLAALAKFLKII